MRILLILLGVLLVLFQYNFWFGKNGYTDYKETEAAIAEHTAENEKLTQRNQQISAEIKDLRTGFNAVEERARLNYEMIKPGETFYRIAKEQ